MPAIIKSYRDILVWQKGMDLGVGAYAFARELPNFERFAMSDQIRRAALSIPSNIAEGWGKTGKGSYLNHLSHSRGSLRELETIFLLAGRVGYGKAETHRVLMAQCDEIGRMLFSLSASVERSVARGAPSHLHTPG